MTNRYSPKVSLMLEKMLSGTSSNSMVISITPQAALDQVAHMNDRIFLCFDITWDFNEKLFI